jgi:hypothetical protein
VSLLAREILQYASNIGEAYRIASNHETFVAESFLIGSASENRAVVIEKSPDAIALYEPDTNYIIVTNHFQSDTFLHDPLNIENMENETSVYRHARVRELISENPCLTPAAVAAILRDYKGLQNKNIGLGNEKAVNQFIAHHSIIFQPGKRRLWIAGPPYQLGEYRGYDLGTVFENKGRDMIAIIPADTMQLAAIYPGLQKYRALACQIKSGEFHENDADSLIRFNPEYYHTYRILGDYFREKGQRQRADDYDRMALEKEAPSATAR